MKLAHNHFPSSHRSFSYLALEQNSPMGRSLISSHWMEIRPMRPFVALKEWLAHIRTPFPPWRCGDRRTSRRCAQHAQRESLLFVCLVFGVFGCVLIDWLLGRWLFLLIFIDLNVGWKKNRLIGLFILVDNRLIIISFFNFFSLSNGFQNNL